MAKHGVQWRLKDSPEIDLGVSMQLPKILLQLMAQRGIRDEAGVRGFLQPRLQDLADPYEIPQMLAAVDRILTAVDEGQRVLVYGDYDVDGITSVTLMLKILAAYGLEGNSFIPLRGSEGYGLSEAAIKRLIEENGVVDLLITVDCGTTSIDEIALLNAKGIDVIVVDHHELSEHGEPDCVAVVNPKLGDDFDYLCAAGVVFKLAHGLLKKRKVEGFDLKEFLELVAVATVADIVPLVKENRLLVRHGLARIPNSKNVGLQALRSIAELKGNVTSMDVGFRIGPRINAAGRMDEPEEALKLLLCNDPTEAHEMGSRLNAFNIQRQKFEREIQEEALAMLENDYDPKNDPVIVLGSRNWHPGVVGIVASRLMRRYYKPTFVIAIDDEGIGKGSGRSVEGVSLVGAIRHGDEHLITGGGHDMAAGLSIDEEKMDSFRESFGKYVLENTSEEDRVPRIYIDAQIDFGELSLEFLDSYELLQPFGSKNPQPLFMSREVWLTEAPRRLKNNHLKLYMRQGLAERDAIFFCGGERDLPDPPWDVAFTIDRNTFRGTTSLQMVIQDIRAAEAF